VAGVIVGIVALPLAIAFAIASGLPPERGLYTAIIAGFLISAFGGSRVQIGGPTGAFVVIVYGIVTEFGLKLDGPSPPEFLEKWGAYVEHIGTSNPHAAAVAALSLAILLVWPRISRRIPGPLVAIQVGVVLAAFLFMRRMSEVSNVTAVTAEFGDDVSGLPTGTERGPIAGVAVYEIIGPFFFGAAEKFRDTLATIGGRPQALILRMRHVMTMDSTGIHALREVIRRSRNDGTLVFLSELRSQPLVALDRAGVLDEIGEDGLTGSVEEAIERARAAGAVAGQ
jgi:MFS superfamily sulfate permease-like transporter